MSTKLRIGNISASVAVADLCCMFGKFGFVESVEIARDAKTGLSRRFAIVEMSHDSDADNAIGCLNLTAYSGRTIGVSRVHPLKRAGEAP